MNKSLQPIRMGLNEEPTRTEPHDSEQ